MRYINLHFTYLLYLLWNIFIYLHTIFYKNEAKYLVKHTRNKTDCAKKTLQGHSRSHILKSLESPQLQQGTSWRWIITVILTLKVIMSLG